MDCVLEQLTLTSCLLFMLLAIESYTGVHNHGGYLSTYIEWCLKSHIRAKPLSLKLNI